MVEYKFTGKGKKKRASPGKEEPLPGIIRSTPSGSLGGKGIKRIRKSCN